MINSRILLSAALLAAFMSPRALAADAADDPEVEALFKQLSAEDSKTRDAARKQLVERGDDAVPQIKALAAKSEDPETRAGVAAVLDAIEARSVTGPSLITLDLKDVPVQDAIRQIAEQAHTELAIWPDWVFKQGPLKDKKVSLNVKRQPFWKVMKDLLPGLGLQLTSMGMGSKLTIQQGQGEMMKGPAHIEGPFMVVATNANESNTISYAKPQERMSSVYINMQVFVEPKVRLLGRAWSPVVEEFTDDAGHSLMNADQQREQRRQQLQSHTREPAFNMNVPVQQVKGRTKKVARLKGYVPVLAQTGGERIEVPNITKAKGSVQSKGGWRLEVLDLADANGQYTLKFKAVRETPAQQVPGQMPPDQWRDRLDSDAIRLLDADGKPLERGGGSLSGNNQTWTGELSYRRTGTPAGPPEKLVWEFPTTAEELRIPFEFKDLPLP